MIPYLADAVPGWFQAALTLYDAAGTEVAFSDHCLYQPDPLLAYKVPRDGEYVLEIKDALYRGREDFVYRIEAGELPYITSIFPLGGPAKTRTTVALEGWNLPTNSLTVASADMKPGILPLSVRNGDLVSNSVLFAVDRLPESLKQESNHTAATAQPVTLPLIINGRIIQPGSWDVYRFEGRAGQALIAEVVARRLGSPLDSLLKLTDAGGKTLAYNDDWEDKGQGLQTHHADSLLRVTLPANGTYFLHVGDGQGQGSSAHAYRLRVSAPNPDFELRVTPCSINARPGSSLAITVHAVRKDGFVGDIDLFLTYAPVDFALSGAKIPADQDVVRVMLQVPTTIRPRPVNLVLEGRALIQGKKVVRVATPAEDMMQAFIYHHLVPVNDLMVTVSGQARPRFPAPAAERAHQDPGRRNVTRSHRHPACSQWQQDSAGAERPAGRHHAQGNGGEQRRRDPGDPGRWREGHAGSESQPDRGGVPRAPAKPGGGAGKRLQSLGTLPAIPFEVLKLGR